MRSCSWDSTATVSPSRTPHSSSSLTHISTNEGAVLISHLRFVLQSWRRGTRARPRRSPRPRTWHGCEQVGRAATRGSPTGSCRRTPRHPSCGPARSPRRTCASSERRVVDALVVAGQRRRLDPCAERLPADDPAAQLALRRVGQADEVPDLLHELPSVVLAVQTLLEERHVERVGLLEQL